MTSVYLRTSNGTVKAHVDTSLMNKGSTPCLFVLENPHQVQKVPLLDAPMISETENVIKGMKDVFLPQIEDAEIEHGIVRIEYFLLYL